MNRKDIYEQLKEVLLPEQMDNHGTDLYVEVCEVSTKIIKDYKFQRNVTTFFSSFDNTLWYDIPFAYIPAWEDK